MMIRILAVLLILTFSGCWNPFKSDDRPQPEPKSVYLPPTSPENLLKNLQTAYGLRDSTGCRSLLDKDFIFHFSEQDANELPFYGVTSGFWKLKDELQATRNLFDPKWSGGQNSRAPADSIKLVLQDKVSQDWRWFDEATNDTLVWKQIVDVPTTLDLTAGERIYLARGYSTFKFKPYYDGSGKLLNEWKILDWQDMGVRLEPILAGSKSPRMSPGSGGNYLSGGSITIGLIKALFYR